MCRLGAIDYQAAWDLQRQLAVARRHDRIPNVLLLLEHPATYTLGRGGKREHILISESELRDRGIALYEVDRGGDVTYHGPGQLVGYPIFKLPPGRPDYVRYIRGVEAAMLEAVLELGVPATLQRGYSGVWVGDEKVCAIGVKVDASGVTTHGFALNVNADLSFFEHIIPCGLTGKGVTSLERLLGRHVSPSRVMSVVVDAVARTFEFAPQSVGRNRLLSSLRHASAA